MIFLFLLERKPFTNKNIQSYEHHNNSRKSSQSKDDKRKSRLLASPTKNANFSPYRRFHRQSSSINIEKQKTLNLQIKNMSPIKNKNDLSMSPEMKKMPKKKNSENFGAHGIIHLQTLGNEDKIIYSGFKKSKQNENNENDNKKNDIDMKRIDILTSRRKRENLNIRDSDSPLKPAFKQSKNIHPKSLRKEEKEYENDNNIEFVDQMILLLKMEKILKMKKDLIIKENYINM